MESTRQRTDLSVFSIGAFASPCLSPLMVLAQNQITRGIVAPTSKARVKSAVNTHNHGGFGYLLSTYHGSGLRI